MSEIERGNPVMSEGNLYRFYKSNLPAVIWNPEKNRPLAEFQKGVFETKKKKVAQKLLELGYPQVSPLATEPPDIVLGLPGKSIDTSATSVENIRPGAGENQDAKSITPVKVAE